MGWIGRQIACQMMKTADYLAVTPSFSAHALLARGSCGEWEPRRSCRSPGPIAFPSCCFFRFGLCPAHSQAGLHPNIQAKISVHRIRADDFCLLSASFGSTLRSKSGFSKSDVHMRLSRDKAFSAKPNAFS